MTIPLAVVESSYELSRWEGSATEKSALGFLKFIEDTI